ncbi:MAG: hypothetical protein M1837_002907 [Sclerophora amabilis]|nr:MAG: hypothetical protein M1837_002907 [Sclerophora amabilis]
MEVGGLVLAALSITYELTSRIYTYTRDVKGAQTTIQGLSSELFSLIGVLEYIRPPVQPDLGEKGGGDGLENPARLLSTQPAFKRVLEETLTFLQDLYRSLEIPKNRLASVVQKLKWPLKEEETRRHLERIERVKSFFVLAVSSDDLFGSPLMFRRLYVVGSERISDTIQGPLKTDRISSLGVGYANGPRSSRATRRKALYD